MRLKVFAYDHPEQRVHAGMEQMPVLCGTMGSCMDLNGYLTCAARSLGVSMPYLAGYWVGPEKSDTHDMQCWLAFRLDGAVVFWGLAHHLKWRVSQLALGLNSAGGRRALMIRPRSAFRRVIWRSGSQLILRAGLAPTRRGNTQNQPEHSHFRMPVPISE